MPRSIKSMSKGGGILKIHIKLFRWVGERGMLKRIDTNVMNLINFGFDCFSDLDTNVKDGYECYIFNIGWV